MSTDKSKKTDNEVSLTRRALIKAGWAIPVILSIGLPTGDVFAKSSMGRGYGQDKRNRGIGHGASG